MFSIELQCIINIAKNMLNHYVNSSTIFLLMATLRPHLRNPIRAVIIRVINKITRESDFFNRSMITDRIGRHEILLPIYHNLNKICELMNRLFNI